MYLYAYVSINKTNYANTFSKLSLPSFEDLDILILHISIAIWLFACMFYKQHRKPTPDKPLLG